MLILESVTVAGGEGGGDTEPVSGAVDDTVPSNHLRDGVGVVSQREFGL